VGVTTSSNYRALLEIIDLSIALGNGNLTGGNHVVFTSGDEMRGEDLMGPGAAGALFLRGGDSLGAGGDGGDVAVRFGSPDTTGNVGTIYIGDTALLPPGIPAAEIPGSVLIGGDTRVADPGGLIWVMAAGGNPMGLPIAAQAGSVWCEAGGSVGALPGGLFYARGGTTPVGAPVSGLGGVENAAYLLGGDADNDDDAGQVNVQGGESKGTAGDGGQVTVEGGPIFVGGNVGGVGGPVYVQGGVNLSGSGQPGGLVDVAGGNPGGKVTIQGGPSSVAVSGGDVVLTPGGGVGAVGVVQTTDATSGHQMEGYCTVGSLASPIGVEKLRVVGDARVEGKLTVTGLIDPTGLVVAEQIAKPFDPTGTIYGVYWVQRGTPCLPYFTDDQGNDHNLLGGGGVGTYDSYLDQGAGADADPIFTDMPPIQAKIAGLPVLSVGYPATNTLHFLPGTNLSLVTPFIGAYALPNTEIRGTAPIGPLGTVANDAAVVTVSNVGFPGATFEDVRTFKDVCFSHASFAIAPTFFFTNSPYCEFDNVSTLIPANASPTVGIWYQTFPGKFERLRINKTILGGQSLEMDGGTLDVIVETGNQIANSAFIGTGNLRFFLKGSGNYISTSQGPTLDIEIGDGTVGVPPKFSGAETFTFGAGTHSWNWSGGPVPPGTTGYQLCPGGGMLVGDPPPPDPGGGGTQLQAGRTVRGIVRGIHVQIGANVSNANFNVWILEGGVLKYQEGPAPFPFSLLGCVGLGTYLSTTFAELTGTFPLAVWIVPAALSQGDWDHINVSFFVR